jgi:hypothetical protein
MPAMVAHHEDSDGVIGDSKEEVIREPLQIDPS